MKQSSVVPVISNIAYAEHGLPCMSVYMVMTLKRIRIIFLNTVLSICLHEKESCIFIYVVCIKYIDTIAGIVININMILIAVLIMKNG